MVEGASYKEEQETLKNLPENMATSTFAQVAKHGNITYVAEHNDHSTHVVDITSNSGEHNCTKSQKTWETVSDFNFPKSSKPSFGEESNILPKTRKHTIKNKIPPKTRKPSEGST